MKRSRVILAVVLAVVLVLLLVWMRSGAAGPKDVTLTRSLAAIDAGKVRSADINDAGRKLTLTLRDGTRIQSGYPASYATRIINELRSEGVPVKAAGAASENRWLNFALGLVPLAMIIVFLWWLLVKRGLGGVNTLSKRSAVSAPETRFSDIAGLDETISELSEVAEWMRDRSRFVAAGAKVPHGILLVGPPGVGKTLVARAVAGEAGVPFYALSGSDFVETFVGVGAARVRSIFEQAGKHERCVIFIDELDAIGQKRHGHGGGTEERETTLNQLLVELDGFADRSVIVLGATNRSDVLDPALLRPGRFDRRISVPAPDRRGRAQILALYARKRSFTPDVSFEDLARRTVGFTGADLNALLNEGALEAARDHRVEITADDLRVAFATTVLGRARHSALVTERDRSITAWHEGAHALVALSLPDASDPVQVTIIPHSDAGGVTWMGGTDHTFLTRGEALAQLQVLLAGRAGERLLMDGEMTQGAANDLSRATKLASNMVRQWGMSELGPMTVDTDASVRLNDRADELTHALLTRAGDDVAALLEARRVDLEAIANRLLSEETLHLEQLQAIVGDGHADAVSRHDRTEY